MAGWSDAKGKAEASAGCANLSLSKKETKKSTTKKSATKKSNPKSAKAGVDAAADVGVMVADRSKAKEKDKKKEKDVVESDTDKI